MATSAVRMAQARSSCTDRKDSRKPLPRSSGAGAMRLSIRQKIILPFAVLLVFVGVVGTGVATTQLTSSAAAQFDANLLHNSLVANQLLAQLDLARTADLRLATDTVGVPEAVLSDDVNALTRLLSPVAANVTAATTVVSVVDSHGAVLLRIENTPDGASPMPVTDSRTFADQPDVVKVLSGSTDAGERRAFLWQAAASPVVHWVGPIRIPGGRAGGASLIGESLAEIARNVQGSVFYDLTGNRLATLLPNPASLPDGVRRQITNENAQRIDDHEGNHVYRALFSTWTMRGRQLGYLAVEANADSLFSLVDQVRLVLTLIFTAAAVLTLIVGSATAWLLTRPVHLLVQSMRAVSAGDLQHRAAVVSRDEIGYLARTFNEGTASVEEKTSALVQTTIAAIVALARAIDG